MSLQELIQPESRDAYRVKKLPVVPSLIKWTGSKRSLAPKIMEFRPNYKRYFEPFLGGGSMLYLAATSGSVASDVYKPLIELWKLIQNDPNQVIDNYRIQSKLLHQELDSIDHKSLLSTKNIPNYFYMVRDRFNSLQDPLDLNFIMRTCVNGIVRFNTKGDFNNSFHLSRRGMEPDRFQKNVILWNQAIKDVLFVCQDYKVTLDQSKKGDFVYLDPPYAGNNQRYIDNLEVTSFFNTLESLNKRGVFWALSFDGSRGDKDLIHDVPESLYKRHVLQKSGNSAVNKVLNGPLELVSESLYLNY
jgi:DNA adenine methylase